MRYSANCDICPIVQASGHGRVDVIRGDHWIANIRTDDQTFLGTTYITLRDHKDSLPELSIDEEAEFIVVRNKLINAQMEAFGAKVINVSCLMNNTFQDDAPAPHIHYHLKPRYDEAVHFEGETFEDPQFGHYITDKTRRPVSKQFARQIANTLRDTMRRQEYLD